MIVTMRHARTIPGFSAKPGFCARGMCAFARRHGISLREFAKNGIEAARLEATGDAFAIALVQWARECEAQEQPHG
jgi:hypothetical protein